MPKDSKKVKITVTFSNHELDEFSLIAKKQSLSLQEYFESALEEMVAELKEKTRFSEGK